MGEHEVFRILKKKKKDWKTLSLPYAIGEVYHSEMPYMMMQIIDVKLENSLWIWAQKTEQSHKRVSSKNTCKERLCSSPVSLIF